MIKKLNNTVLLDLKELLARIVFNASVISGTNLIGKIDLNNKRMSKLFKQHRIVSMKTYLNFLQCLYTNLVSWNGQYSTNDSGGN